MTTNVIIQAIDEEISRLERVKALLNGNGTSKRRAARSKMSEEGRARIAAAQKKRWAKVKGKKKS